MSLASDFRECRRVGTPIVCVQTTDVPATIRTLQGVRVKDDDPDPDAAVFSFATGAVAINGNPGSLGDADSPPFMVLRFAKAELPDNGILYYIVPDTFSDPGHTWTNPYTISCTTDLRDPFKSTGRTLVILSVDGKMPPALTDDVPLLRDPRPDKAALVEIAQNVCKAAKVNEFPAEHLTKAAGLCLGMSRFPAEEVLARKISSKGFKLDELAVAQREAIELASQGGIKFDRGGETFENIGGLAQIKKFSKRLFDGTRPPAVVVRIEEIEKSMAGIGSAGLGDTSGVSQDQLGVLLTCMEDYDWAGLIAVGPAGSGKSMVSRTMGATYGVPTVNLDLGALKGSYVGQSEQNIRKAMDILKSFAGSDAFFVATSNGLSIIPPELRRRFRFGVWYFDLLTGEERKQVWAINLAKFGLDASLKKPKDDNWVGSDIRNVCDLAARLKCSLMEAAEFIVPVYKSNPAAVEKLRDDAHGKLLSASSAGVYEKPKAGRRNINLN